MNLYVNKDVFVTMLLSLKCDFSSITSFVMDMMHNYMRHQLIPKAKLVKPWVLYKDIILDFHPVRFSDSCFQQQRTTSESRLVYFCDIGFEFNRMQLIVVIKSL